MIVRLGGGGTRLTKRPLPARVKMQPTPVENGSNTMARNAVVDDQRGFPWAGRFTALLVACGMACCATASAVDLAKAVVDGKTSLGFRYRLEHVSQDGIDEDALASTARARLTWNSAETDNFAFGIETDYSLILGIEDFNSTTNGRTEYPVVADPKGFDLNQAFVKYANGDTTVTVGRQRINHGGQRILGGVAYRQNEQTYDALRIESKAGNIDLDYSYIHNVNRIFGPGDAVQPGDWYGNSHAFRASATPTDGHTLAGFAYLFDLSNANGPPNANATYGFEYQGKLEALTLSAAVARQSDYADNPVSYEALYYMVQGIANVGALTLTGAYEVLGSDDGNAGFRTPVATLHKFQGWTDRFLGTPAAGVRDLWFSVAGKVGDATVTGVFHDFQADEGGADYGSEIGLAITYPLRDNLSFLFKTAQYSADEHATDITKVWLMLDWKW